MLYSMVNVITSLWYRTNICMKLIDYIIIGVIAGLLAFAITIVIKNKKNGKCSGCSGCCDGCKYQIKENNNEEKRR